ncbi:MAG: prolipoprotein diacylglyceryl transferase [Treponema sp.]|nr:prolipoprotein diacylglyceryl transferase [Treponema sp.]
MFPYIEIFGRSIGLFQIMLLCGIFSSGIYACLTAIKFNLDYTDVIIFILLLSVGAIIGSYLLYILVNYRKIIFIFNNINAFKNILGVLQYIFSGSVFYGGLLGGIFTGYILIKKNNVYQKYVDIIFASIPLFHFFGRIGCFLGGCCFGISCKFGLMFTNNPIPEANGITRFPVQLLEAFFNISLFFLLNHLLNKGKFKNNLLYVYLIIYAIGRFFIEFLRGDEFRGIWFYLSTSQVISILIVLTVLIKIFIIRKRNKIIN